jgi:hypothetical protein
MVLNVTALMLLCFSLTALAEYIEGIDTTDANGYGIDSAFIIGSYVSGHKLVCYTDHEYGTAINIFKYSFNEINLSADSLSLSSILRQGPFVFSFPNHIYCFVIRNPKDSCYSKVQIIKHFLLDTNTNDWRYIYRYGTNTTPLNRIMQYSAYDRSVRYKPNNLCYLFDVNASHSNNLFAWEPPSSNDNHLQGYIIYMQKRNIVIDTAAPINIAQWDSVGFTDTTRFSLTYFPHGEYYNIVAVYTEGKSDFLKGWTQLYRPDHIRWEENSLSNFTIFSSIVEHRKGLFEFNVPVSGTNLVIFDPSGRQKAYFSRFTGRRVLWNTNQQNIPPGLYLFRAEFPDRSVITQPFTITR